MNEKRKKGFGKFKKVPIFAPPQGDIHPQKALIA